jgi:chromosome partitioning protein
MHVIGVLNSKGGCGKSTLTTCLAVRASQERPTAVVDLDPQGSYVGWYERRGSPENPILLMGEDRASDAIEALRQTSPYNYVFIDGPTNALGLTEDAIKSATLVIIPMKCSPFDLEAARDCIALCQEHKRPFLVVINDKGARDTKLVDQAMALLASWKAPVAKMVVPHRVSYMNAIATGKTGPEKDKSAAEDIDALWAEVKSAIRKATR